MTIDNRDLPFHFSGGFVRMAAIPEKLEHFWDIDHPDEVIDACRRRPERPDLLSFWQRLPETDPKFDYPMEWDNVAAIRIGSYDRWLSEQVHPNTRNKVRKAERSKVIVRVTEFDEALVEGIVRIFAETPTRQGRRFTNYNKTFDEVKAEWSADLERSTFLGAYVQQELIGFIKLIDTGRYFRTSGTISMVQHRDKAPMNALIAASVKLSEERQQPFLVYGKYVYGKKGADGLTEFKKHNGFEAFYVPRYYVPLTLKGRLALALRLHKPLIQQLPAPVVRTLVRCREMATVRQ